MTQKNPIPPAEADTPTGMPPPPRLDLAWASNRWEDPMTGTRVVKLSPDLPMHFRNAYFRTPLFTPDGRTLLMAAYQPEVTSGRYSSTGGTGSTDKKSGITEAEILALDLLSGEYRSLGTFPVGKMGLWFAAAPRGRVVHVIVNCGEHEEIERIELDSGNSRRIVPSQPFRFIWDATCSADLRYIYTPDDLPPRPEGMSNTAWYHRGPEHYIKRHVMRRIDLETGETLPVFETDWEIAHPNPNPVRPELFMCCQDQPDSQGNFQRVWVRDTEAGHWLDMPWKLRDGGVSHEMWTRDGTAIYGHAGLYGYQIISRFRLAKGEWESFVVPIGLGDSAHVHIAPDESFLLGDGKNFGWNTEHEAAGKAGDGDNVWAFDGVGCHSPGEIIWKFELPEESLLTPDHDFHRRDDLLAPVYRNPDKVVRTTPVCRFRSLARVLNKPMRLENNVEVTLDSRWAVMQSCSEAGLFEIWAARIPGS